MAAVDDIAAAPAQAPSTLRRDTVVALAVVAALATVPFLTDSLTIKDFVVRCAAYGLFATSLNLLVGYGGMVSFGHGLFFGLGAYSFGLFMQKTGLPIPLGILFTICMSALVALVIGLICIRLGEIYFAFLTLAFQMLFHSVIVSWVSFTGGDQGLRGGIPRPPFLGIDLNDANALYWFAVVMLVGGLYVMRHIVESPFGYTLRMIRDNEKRAGFLGVDVLRTRLIAFILAGIFGSLGGLVMALFVSGAYPDFAFWTTSGEAIFMIMMGGISTFLGPMLGTVMLLLFNDIVARVTEHHGLALGLVVLLFALGFRKGVGDFIADRWRERKGEG
jgi:branched-chain amino acid transport system permease protein